MNRYGIVNRRDYCWQVLIKYRRCEVPAKISFGEIEETDLDEWFLVHLRNVPYSTCNITADYDLNVDGLTVKCTLTLNVTYCDHQNSTDVYEFLITDSERLTDNSLESRERREIFLTTSTRSAGRVSDVLDELDSLLHKGNLSITSHEVHHVLDQVDCLLDSDRIESIPGELLHGLDKLGTRFKLETNFTGSIVRDNFAMLMADLTPGRRLRGMRIPATPYDSFADIAFAFITEENEATLQLAADKNEAVILLPLSATRIERRISLVAFRNSRSFVSDNTVQLNSKVLSINMENFSNFEDEETIDIYLNPRTRVHHRNQSRTCGYWHFNDNGTGFWSQEGCTFIKAREEGMLDLCQCNHLTHFAEILISRNMFSESDESILEIISIIGCFFSLFGLTAIALTAALFKSWRENESNKIWLNLGSAVFILDICFLVTVFVDFDDSVAGCVVVGAALHYSVLATFCWMLVVSTLSFRKLVLVFNRELPCKLLITALFAWGFPLLVIGILFAVNPNAYSGRFEEMTPSGKFCYPKGSALWASVFLPMVVMWLINWTLYSIIVRSMFESKKNIRRHTSSKETLRCASISCLLAFLCGIPWVFGFFAYNIVAAYLFSITVTFQGFVLFLFFILGNKKTRGLWIGLFRKRSRRTVIITSADRSNKDANTARFLVVSNSSSSPGQASGSLLSESRL